MTDSNEDAFSFPVLSQPSEAPKKLPLTAFSTVTDRSGDSADKPTPSVPLYEKPARSKVPLEKGYTQVDWLRLSKSGTDLNGLDGRPLRRDITLAEVAGHASPDDAWMALRGKVYNIGPYARFHPGGAAILLKAAGKDGTALFAKYHPWVNADALLEKCLIGTLAQE
ncbi:hypothetical protein PLESTB_000188000 [Pleodorina starrii]|uniref:Cytochrome b5 heme-binding domain-containing protein n=1 Tax=Pleodorina starrii TaxID=330485 RepID=A0A9W6EXP7_9CHLO|nr:hypothetical protein PLESTM_000343100 [Pleodorina starrii]GLC49153.1 hypothetical protein PLESTB_000188000 [Pleodorina starrii]GLC73590.1 hypothetical protein PLESTF_001394600 [Pleodorina starrii]